MDVCSFVRAGSTRCGSRFNCKEVEFRHPDYRELSKLLYLCESHFREIFGQSAPIKDSVKPLEIEEWLKLLYLNAKSKFQNDLENVTEKVRAGMGLEFFDFKTWRASNGKKRDDAYTIWQNYRKKECKYEWCDLKISYLKKVYTIRVYPKNQRDYVNLVFCCLDHWEVFKKRIGIKGLKGSLDPTRKKPSLTLDDYAQENLVAET